MELALTKPDESIAIVGEDTTIEMGVEGEPIEPIMKDGKVLRFALLGQVGTRLVSIQSRELVVATSYPVMAAQLMTQLGIKGSILEVSGCVEAELTGAPSADVAIELVQSGDSVRQNNLAIIEDYLYPLRLMKVGEGGI